MTSARIRGACGVAAAALVALAGTATATDAQMRSAAMDLDSALAAERAAQGGDSSAAQAAYNRARDLQEAVRAAGPVSSACSGLEAALRAAAETLVGEQEAFDKLDSAARSRARAQVDSRASAVRVALRACTQRGTAVTPARVAMQPATGEVFYGTVVATVPAGAKRVSVVVNGQRWKEAATSGATIRFTTTGKSQAYDFRMTFTDQSGATVGVASADSTWLLPPSARRAVPGRRSVPATAGRLASAAQGFSGTSGLWVQDLTTGTYAGTNAGAKFPAASLVKLGVLAGAVARMGANAQKSPYFYDLQRIARWSSNLAANRIVDSLGSGCGTSRDALANDGLRRLGARSSTYTGCYIVGTELQPALPDAPATSSPALDTSRYTTAQDLARMLFAIQASAVGAPGARAQTGLSPKQGRLLLGLLLASEQVTDNRSLFAGGLPSGTPLAQKNGWIRSARGGAGIAFLQSGPVIMTLLTQSSAGVSLSAAQGLGNREAGIATTLNSR